MGQARQAVAENNRTSLSIDACEHSSVFAHFTAC